VQAYPDVFRVLGTSSGRTRFVLGLSACYDPVPIQSISNFFSMVLNWLYSVVPNYPVDIILMTILLKLILEPLTYQQLRTSFVISRIQGELQEIAKKYKNDPQQAAQEQSKIYKEHGVNPLIGCLLPLLQIPIFFGLYGSLVQNP